ncbi:MAG: glycosyltransferase family protein [Parcubacteria group bacterium]|nr:glycosyltransferase family protein [Parcubacteria group bacterium]
MKKENAILCIIQARMGSTRLPGKVLKEVNGMSLLEYQVRRIRQAKNKIQIVLATSLGKENDAIEHECKKIGVSCFRGSENDVLDRFYQCALRYPEYDAIMRLTADCPLVDPGLIDRFIDYFNKGDYDYVGPSVEFGNETFPEGVAEIEIFTKDALNRSAEEAGLASEREHLTLYMRNSPSFKKGVVSLENNVNAKYRLTVDNPEDFEVVSFVIIHSDITDGYEKHIALLKTHPEISQKNIDVPRNEGLGKSLKNDRVVRKNPKE